MSTHRWYPLLTACLLVTALGLPPLRGDTKTSASGFGQKIAAAKAFAAERSWALARDAYAAALPAAPDAETRRWCELGLEDASWRASPVSRWAEDAAEVTKHRGAFARLLRVYAEAGSRDDFWLAVALSNADFLKQCNDARHWAERLDIADYLAAQPPSPDAAHRYVEYLQEIDALAASNSNWGLPEGRLLAHLDSAARIAVTADERAWCRGTFASLSSEMAALPVQERDERWKTALAACRGTPWEPVVRARELIWRIRRHWGRDRQDGSPADPAAALAALEALRVELASVAGPQTAQAVQALKEFSELLGKRVVQLTAPDRILPGTPLRFGFGVANVESLHATLTRTPLKSWLIAETSDDEQGAAGTETVRAWDIPLSDVRPGAWNSAVIEAVPRIEPGFYELMLAGRAGSEVTTTSVEVVVSTIGGVAFGDDRGAIEFFLEDLATGQPTANAAVAGAFGIEGQPIEPIEARTDRDGRFRLVPKSPGDHDDHNGFLVVTVGDQPVMAADLDRYRSLPPDRLILDAIFDRPLYRPGDTVRWKLIARERQDGRFLLPAAIPGLVFGAVMDREPIFGPVPLVFDAFGTAHGEFPIPAAAKPGMAGIAVGVKHGEEGERLGMLAEAFRVDNYVAPAIEAKMELASGPASLRPGRQVVIRVRASYLSGAPAIHAKVECKLSCDRFWGDRDIHYAFGPQAKAWVEQLQEPLRGTTDENGVADFASVLPPDLNESWLSADASVLPEGAAEVKARSGWGVTPAGSFLDTGEWRGPRPASPGAEVVFDGRLFDGTNAPLAAACEARLVELRWTEAWLDPAGSIMTGPDLQRAPGPSESDREDAGWHQIHSGYAETVVETQASASGADGRVAVRFRIPRPGIFQIRLYRDGKLVAGGTEPLTVAPTVFAVNDQTESLALPPGEAFIAGPSTVKQHQPFELLAVLPEGKKTGWVSLCGERETATFRCAARGRIARVTVDRPPAFAGEGRAQLVWLDADKETPGRPPVWSTLRCVDDALPLSVALAPRELVARPGSPSSVAIQVAQAGGAPAKAALGLAVFDEAVAILAGQAGQTPPVGFTQIHHTTMVHGDSIGMLSRFVPAPIEDTRVLRIAEQSEAEARAAAQWNFPAAGYESLAESTSEEVIKLSPFEVASAADGNYQASESLAGTRLRTDLHDSRVMDRVPGAEGGLKIEIRRHFSPTACWAPDVITDDRGKATVPFTYPDNLTQWRIEAYAVGADGVTFGRAAAFTRTSLPFQARLQQPRFLVAGDSMEPTAVLLNRTDAAATASAVLSVSGPLASSGPEALARTGIALPKQGEAHIAWTVVATAPGEGGLVLNGRTEHDGDAMALTLPVLPDGIEQQTAATGKLGAEAAATELRLDLPGEIDARRMRTTLQLTPSETAVVLDALPYLVDYPYGCVEQTVSRFLPAVIVRKTLTDFGLAAGEVEKRILGGESAADAARRAATAGLGRIDDVVQQSLTRLAKAQRGDGSFGWWDGSPSGDLWMTSYVAWSLGTARTAGVDVPAELETRTLLALGPMLRSNDPATDAHAWALAALSRAKLEAEFEKTVAKPAFDRLYAGRDRLSAGGRACLALAAAKWADAPQRAILLRNLENGLVRAPGPGLGATAHWGRTNGYWRATDGAVETTALTLLALLELDPKHPLIEPAVNWLVLNRRCAHWQSTRETAFAVLALAQYTTRNRELATDVEVEITLNRRGLGRIRINRDAVLRGPVGVDVPAEALRPGTNAFTIRRIAGRGPLYALVLSSAWAASDGLKPAGYLVDVARALVRQKSQPTLVGTLRITPEPLADRGSAVAGERVTAAVRITVPNELEYVMVEVPKPAGCEPLNPLSGWDARIRRITEPSGAAEPDEGRVIYREERDDKSIFFLDSLGAGTWEIRYDLRAVTPGDFRILPVQITAMYVPEISANSAARRLKIARPE